LGRHGGLEPAGDHLRRRQPGALEYIKKTGAALKSILKNPLPFVGNLVKAAKLGFSNFGSNLLEHLKAGLIDWLTGSLPGIYIPRRSR